ncbi:MAG: amphi-Trp domain-containing protein [Anaerolineales bacterium]|nr:amphi-Trp domain-containing protein [Anaerolineales bacterium]
MDQEKKLFKSEERYSQADIAAFLRQLADKIEGGQVMLQQGGQEQKLAIPHHLFMEIEVEDEVKTGRGTQHSLEIELKWFDDMATNDTLKLT